MRLFVASIVLAGACTPADALEISNFRSGLACTNTSIRDDNPGWICHVTEDIFVTDQGTCRYNGEDMACTWAGFEFDYRGAKPGDKLECSIEQSQPTALGNPKEELSKEATTQDFVLPLEKIEGHFYNPQYFSFAARPLGKDFLLNKGHCSFAGKILFEYTYRVRFPTLPDHRTGV